MAIEDTSVKIGLTVREAQALLMFLRQADKHDFRWPGEQPITSGAIGDCMNIKYELEQLLLMAPSR